MDVRISAAKSVVGVAHLAGPQQAQVFEAGPGIDKARHMLTLQALYAAARQRGADGQLFGGVRMRQNAPLALAPIWVALAVFFLFVTTSGVFAQDRTSAAVFSCKSKLTCNAQDQCVEAEYRAAILDIHRFNVSTGANAFEKLFLGPLLGGSANVTGGLFFNSEHFSVYDAPDPSSHGALLADEGLPASENVWVFPNKGWSGLPKTMYHVRPARNVSGLNGDRVATEFLCIQGMF